MEDGIDVIVASSMRELVQEINSEGLTREEIIQIIKDSPNWYLLYQRNVKL